MYAICDNVRPLNEALFFSRSMTESIFAFICLNPRCRSFNVYRDASGSGKLGSCSFVASFNQKQINSFLSSLKKNGSVRSSV